MSPPGPLSSSAQRDMRQAVRAPRASDGVGNALRQIFGGCAALPPEFSALLLRLNKED